MIVHWWRRAPWLTVCTGIALVILLTLGTWQLQRLQWKQALIEDMEAGLAAPPVTLPGSDVDLATYDYRRISVIGRYLHGKEQHLGPRQWKHVSGQHLLTPLILTDGRHLLINRGWIPAEVGADGAIARPDGTVTLTGILRTRFGKGVFTPDYDSARQLWFWYDVEGIAAEIGLPLLPAVLELDPAGASAPTLPIGGVTKVVITNNHLQYALTWYGLAAALVVVFIFFQRQRSQR